jgi:hypothetical protein
MSKTFLQAVDKLKFLIHNLKIVRNEFPSSDPVLSNKECTQNHKTFLKNEVIEMVHIS